MKQFLYLLTLVLLLGNQLILAQTADENLPDTISPPKAQPQHYLWLDASYTSFSNVLNASFFNALNGTSGITSGALSGNFYDKGNYLLLDNTIALRYFNVNKTNSSIFRGFALGYRQFLSSHFPAAAFSLLFHGNSAFAGDTASLDDANLNSQSYSFINTTFQFEFPLDELQKSKIEWSIQPALLVGHAASTLQFTKAGLYTAPYGQFLDIYADYSWNASSSGLFSGIGAGLNTQLTWKTRNGWIASVTLQNLGFIRYGSSSEQVQLDTAFHYEGIQFPVITELNTFTPDTGFADALMDDFYENQKQSGSFTALTAARLEFGLIKYFKPVNILVKAKSISYLQDFSMNYSSVDLAFMPFRKLSFSLNPGIVAYSHFYLNAGLRIRLGDLGALSLEAGDLLGFFNPENSHFQRLNCSLAFLF